MNQQLRRELGIRQAVTIGLASMLGGGVFFVWGPAAAVAGPWLLLGLLLAAAVATLNALSVAQLAMAHPVSGGVYAYGRAELGPAWGVVAGWLFLAGKTCSAAGLALIVAGHLAPAWAPAVAVGVVVLLAAVNSAGVRLTAAVSAVVVAVVLLGLAVVVVLGASAPEATTTDAPLADIASSPFGVLQSAGLLFFAFAGYARMATLGEEVREPRRTLPRAILIALGVTLAVYAVLAAVLLTRRGDALAGAAEPLRDLVPESWAWLPTGLAVLAGLGSLLAILAGLSRTGLALARDRELPGPLSHVSPRTGAPIMAELVFAALAIAAVLLLPTVALIGFSSCAVLSYYAIGHLAALRQSPVARWQPRAIAAAGLLGCLLLALTLPWPAVAGTALLVLLVLLARRLRGGSAGARTSARGK